jgi:serine protease Do
MSNGHGVYPLAGATSLEHLTGLSRGTVTWISRPFLDVTIEENGFINISSASPDEQRDNLVARLQRSEDTYEIQSVDGWPLWINGVHVASHKLANRDLIEFGDAGPLSRFRLYGEDWPKHKSFAEILSDSLAYIRVSRQPLATRLLRAFRGMARPLLHETTRMFRIGVILAIVALAAFAYQQNRLNVLLQQRIDMGSARLETFSGALARARDEALTPNDLKTLRQDIGNRLSLNAERLEALEQRSHANARVIADSLSSVVFLQGAYRFRDRSSGRMLRFIVDQDGSPLISPQGQSLLSLDGNGPEVERKFTGTGFAVGEAGLLVTNRHVVLPWENDSNIEALASLGVEPVMIKFIVYAPGQQKPGTVELIEASEDSDLAVLRRTDLSQTVTGLKFAAAPPSPGDEIIVMGYPTGLRSMLAQSGEAFVDELLKTEDTGFWSIAARLAEKGYIAPLASRGIVSQTTPVTIVYDAETTHGGSGGPVLDIHGDVVAVSSAILPEYGGSNLGVPVAKVRALLEAAGLR